MFKTSATILKGLVALFIGVGPVRADPPAPPCVEDAMIVFDASGSMGGNLDQGIATLKPRIDEVRSALAEVLPPSHASVVSASLPMVRAPACSATSSSTSSPPPTPQLESCASSMAYCPQAKHRSHPPSPRLPTCSTIAKARASSSF